jgi:methionyl-tRNA synthetase
MLMAAGLALPRTVHGHGFVHFEGRKMSKTDGTVVDPLEVVDIYGADSLRYYLMSEVQWGNDGDFAWQRFFERYNADLANNLGNMVNRCLTMIKRYSDGPVAIPDNPSSGADLAFDTSLLKEYLNAIDEIRLHDVSKALISMVDGVNLYIDKTQPWVLAKDESKREELEAVLYNLAESLRWITLCAWPIVPESAEKIWSQMNMPGQLADNNIESLSWGEFPANITVNKPKPVFPRIEQQES